MRNEKRPVVAFYCRLATDEPTEEEKKLPIPTDFLQLFLKEQEVQPCRRYRLFSR